MPGNHLPSLIKMLEKVREMLPEICKAQGHGGDWKKVMKFIVVLLDSSALDGAQSFLDGLDQESSVAEFGEVQAVLDKGSATSKGEKRPKSKTKLSNKEVRELAALAESVEVLGDEIQTLEALLADFRAAFPDAQHAPEERRGK